MLVELKGNELLEDVLSSFFCEASASAVPALLLLNLIVGFSTYEERDRESTNETKINYYLIRHFISH